MISIMKFGLVCLFLLQTVSGLARDSEDPPSLIMDPLALAAMEENGEVPEVNCKALKRDPGAANVLALTGNTLPAAGTPEMYVVTVEEACNGSTDYTSLAQPFPKSSSISPQGKDFLKPGLPHKKVNLDGKGPALPSPLEVIQVFTGGN